MQQVLNRVDRNQAFVKFLVFFLITIVLIVAAVFVNYRLPSAENKRLREQAAVQRQHENSEIRFITVMQEAVGLLDSMDRNSSQIEMLSAQVAGKLADMEKVQQNDNTSFGQLNKTVLLKLEELRKTKVSINDFYKKESSSLGLKGELDKCKTDYDALRRDFDNLREKLPN